MEAVAVGPGESKTLKMGDGESKQVEFPCSACGETVAIELRVPNITKWTTIQRDEDGRIAELIEESVR